MSLEDIFHNNSNNEKTLTARFITNKLNTENLLTNIKSNTFTDLISNIDNSDSTYSSEDLFSNKHPYLSITIKDNIVELNINHRMIGGEILVKLVEIIINSKPRYIPKTNTFHGFLYGLKNLKNIYKLLTTPNNNNNGIRDSLVHYTKRYNININRKSSRIINLYYIFLVDALAALNKEKIIVGIPVPFTGSNVVNNVGIIIFEFNASTTINELENILKEKTNLAYTFNFINLYGKYISDFFKYDNKNLREKIDIICTTLISDNTAIPGDFSFQPNKIVYEGAYASLYIRLSGDKKIAEMYSAVTTNYNNQNWKKCKFIKYS